jgi:uncharacterized membrane protein
MSKRKTDNNILKKLGRNKELIVNIIVMLLIFTFLLNYFKPDLILLKTTTTGGDTGSMIYLAKYMEDYLLPHGKIIGWSPGRWAGFPIFSFQFPLPYVIIALLGYLISLEIAFKIITIFGIFSLPIATFFSMRFMKFKFPIPIIASIFSLHFLFLEKNTVFGGNIPSVLAGEFSYSMSFSLMVLFFGLIYKTIESKRFTIYNSILFSLVLLSHLVTAIVGAFATLFFLITRNKNKFIFNFRYLLMTFLITFLLLGFWLLPMLLNQEFTTGYGRDWSMNYQEWYPEESALFLFLAICGIYIGFRKKDKRIGYLTFILLISTIAFFNAEVLHTANVRFVPIQYFLILMLGSYALGNIVMKLRANYIVPVILIVIMIIWLSNSLTFISYWIKWNYEGYESKAKWDIYNGINQLLKDTPGRAYCDLADINDQFGTSRAFESLPYFSGKPTLEGVYAQATITSPFISYTQCEISHHCAGIPTVAGMERTTSYNLTAGTKHLEMLNVKYLIATYDQLRSDLKESPDWKFVKGFEQWEVYELLTHDGSYVFVPDYKPNLMETKGIVWKNISLVWWMNLEKIDVPIVFVKEMQKEDSARFETIRDLSELTRIKLDNNCTINETVLNEEIRFTTSCVGKPHIIKMSYFPNWQVEGADRVYLVSPSFMLVYPEKENVRIYYGTTAVNILGIIFSSIGLFLTILISIHWKGLYEIKRIGIKKIFRK